MNSKKNQLFFRILVEESSGMRKMMGHNEEDENNVSSSVFQWVNIPQWCIQLLLWRLISSPGPPAGFSICFQEAGGRTTQLPCQEKEKKRLLSVFTTHSEVRRHLVSPSGLCCKLQPPQGDREGANEPWLRRFRSKLTLGAGPVRSLQAVDDGRRLEGQE